MISEGIQVLVSNMRPYYPYFFFVRNHQLLSKLPTPFVSLASHQLAGRGRGSNVWLSPSGCLLFSLLLRVSLSNFPASKLVFIQYLFSLAVVEACRTESVLGSKAGSRIRLKWPNDVYAVIGSDEEASPENVRKVGGVLVTASFSGGNVDIVIGMFFIHSARIGGKCDSQSFVFY